MEDYLLIDGETSLVVRVTDRFGNAIPHTEVLYRMRSDENPGSVERTDELGIAVLDVGLVAPEELLQLDVSLRVTPAARVSFVVRSADELGTPLKLAEIVD